MTNVRDFLYLDVERLKSLYSQLFEGFVERVVETESSEEAADDKQRGSLLSGTSIEARVAVASYKTESRFLYDHMYTLLESRLSDLLISSEDVTKQNYEELFQQSAFIRATGETVIEDYQRIRTMLQRWNELSGALAYVSSFDQDAHSSIDEKVRNVEAQIKRTNDRNKKAKLKEQLDQLNAVRNPTELAKAQGMYLDGVFVQNIELITDMFFEDQLSLVVTSGSGNAGFSYRAILQKQYLRVSPNFLRALFGGYPARNLTIVGQHTYYPTSQTQVPESRGDEPEHSPNMRDAFRNFFEAYDQIERTLIDSEKYTEIIIWPLAIYRQSEVLAGNTENSP